MEALDGGEWLTSCPGCFTCGKYPGTYCVGDWVSPRARLDILEERKLSFPYWDVNPGPSSL